MTLLYEHWDSSFLKDEKEGLWRTIFSSIKKVKFSIFNALKNH